MVSVFLNFEEFGWNSLPISYRQSPYFTINEDLLKQDHKQDLPECEPMSTEDGNECNMNEESAQLFEIPTTKFPKKNQGSQCRELLGQLKSATFLIDNSEIMDELKATLIDSLKKVQDSLPSVEGLVLEDVSRNKRGLHGTDFF